MGFFCPEDEGDTLLRNIGPHKIYTAPHPRRQHTATETSNLTIIQVLNMCRLMMTSRKAEICSEILFLPEINEKLTR
jgi:hypothetical protein